MEPRAVLLSLLLVVLLNLAVKSSADDVKHKKVIIKVPKKINHVHHHHVKKVHVWKHKPKPIHSVHVVEEEHIGKEWKNLLQGKKHKFLHEEKPVHEWEEEEEEYEEEDDHEDEHDTHKKAGSQYNPVVWKGSGEGRKWKDHGGSGSRGRGSTRDSSVWKGDRPKRQKNNGHREERYPEEQVRYKHRHQGRKPPSKPKNMPKYERKPKPKPFRPRDKEYGDYGDYEYFNRDSKVWPERKEHISWHIQPSDSLGQQDLPDVGAGHVGDYSLEYNGEINLQSQPIPDIQVVPPPQLAPPKYTTRTLPLSTFLPPTTKNQLPEFRKPQFIKSPPEPSNIFKTEIEHLGGSLSGYSSHVGHNAEGDSASFQSVRFGEKSHYKESNRRHQR